MELITLELDGRRHELVAGLVWHPLQGTGAARMREILAFAREAGADLKVLRGDDPAHVGLARRSEGARPGQVAVAAVVADALAQEGHRSVLAALPVPGRQGQLLYLAMRDGVILADGDSVAGEEEIRSRMSEDRAYGGWDQVLCPQGWDLSSAAPRTLDSFFPSSLFERPQRWQLRELRVNVVRLGLTCAVLAGVALAGIWAWRTYREQQQIAESLVLAQREKAARGRGEHHGPSSVVPVPPWPLLPRPSDFTQACVAAFAKTGSVAGNWKFEGAVCEAGQLTLRWTKASDAAWVSHFTALRPQAVISADGLTALVSTDASARVAPEAGETLQDGGAMRMRYFELASRYRMTIRMESVPPATPPQLPGQSQGAAPTPPPWVETNVQVSAPIDPVEAARLLDGPGLRLRRITFNVDSNGMPQYQFTGVHYVRP